MRTLLLLLALSGAAAADLAGAKPQYPDAKASYPYQLEIRQFYGAAGYTLDYYLAADGLAVVYRDDFGSKPKEILQKTFSADEKLRWSRFLARFPVDSLNSSYDNPAVSDGLQLFFDFRLPKRAPKKVDLQNRAQPDLARLCDELNRLLPDKLKVSRPRDL